MIAFDLILGILESQVPFLPPQASAEFVAKTEDDGGGASNEADGDGGAGLWGRASKWRPVNMCVWPEATKLLRVHAAHTAGFASTEIPTLKEILLFMMYT